MESLRQRLKRVKALSEGEVRELRMRLATETLLHKQADRLASELSKQLHEAEQKKARAEAFLLAQEVALKAFHALPWYLRLWGAWRRTLAPTRRIYTDIGPP